MTVDYHRHSGWFEFDAMSSTVSLSVINKLKCHFARFGIPQMIMSDNGRQFLSTEFEAFCREWSIEHRASSRPHQVEWHGRVGSEGSQAAALENEA